MTSWVAWAHANAKFPPTTPEQRESIRATGLAYARLKRAAMEQEHGRQ